jgi:outer membrane lipoprotein carrier protein
MYRLFLTIVCLVVMSGAAAAKSIAPLDGLEALRQAVTGITDFTAEIQQEKRLTVMKRTLQMNGTVRFRKPDMFLMEIAAPYNSRMLLRDSTIEQRLGNGERNRIILPAGQGLKQWITRFSAPLTTLPEGMEVHADLSGGRYTLTIVPSATGQVRELVISFMDDGTFRKLVITEKNGDRTTLTFKNVHRNTGLTEKDLKL